MDEPQRERVKIDYAMSKDSSATKGIRLTVVTPLNMRTGAGTSKKIVKVLDRGAKVTWYGNYTKVGTTRWYLVIDASGQTGFCSSVYLKA